MQSRDEQWESFRKHYDAYLTDRPGKGGNTALHQAASNGYEHVVEDLIQQGHDINASNSYGESVMQMAIAPLRLPESDPRAIQQALIDAGAELGVKDKAGRTLLHCAAISNDASMCRYLVERRAADVNDKAFDGSTPLHDAAVLGHGECVEELLKCGADLSIQDVQHKTARDLALNRSCKDALDDHVFEQRMKQQQMADPQSVLRLLASQPRSMDPKSNSRKR